MNPTRRTGLKAALGAALLPSFAHDAWSQEWPAKPVRIIAPFPAGGTTDIFGRLLTQHFSEQFKQSFVLENKAGAGGVIGSDIAAKAMPDGTTLLISGIASHVIAPAVSKTPYHPLDSFSHIALLGGPPSVLAVHADVPARTMREFVAWAKTETKGVSWGSSGTGTHAHLVGELLREATQLNMVHIAYKGGAPAMADLIGKQIPATVTALSSALPHLRTGRIRAIATTASARVAELPEVATFAEAGYPQLTATTWFSLSAPPGMPAALVAQINLETRRALRAPKIRERLLAEGIEPGDLDAAAFTQYVRSEIARWTPLAKAAQTPT